MAAAGITVIKEFLYRGSTEEWSNQYHFTDMPTDHADQRSMADLLIGQEAECYTNAVTVKRALFYDDTDHDAIYVYILSDFGGDVPGALSPGSALRLPGDVAGWVRWATGETSVHGKPIYLRKYFHDVLSDGSPTIDNILAAQKTAYQTFGDALLTDTFDSGHMCGPDGHVPDGPAKAATYATTRTLHRRGRRP